MGRLLPELEVHIGAPMQDPKGSVQHPQLGAAVVAVMPDVERPEQQGRAKPGRIAAQTRKGLAQGEERAELGFSRSRP